MNSFRCMIKKLNIVELIQQQKQGGYKTDMLFLSINYKVIFLYFKTVSFYTNHLNFILL